MTTLTVGPVAWVCTCNRLLYVPADRVVPDHISPAFSRWCGVSRCTLTPRSLGRVA